MIHPLVLHAVQVCKAILVALFLFRTSDTHVLILHIKAAGETNVLVGPSFNKVYVL
jgi:hypothetical protein